MDIIRTELTGKLEEFKIAIEEEIKEVKKNAASGAVPLTNGVKIKQTIDEYTYRFHADTSINIPTDSPATLVVEQNKKYDAVIVSFEEPYLIISTKKDMGEHIGYARLESDLSMLMEKLIDRIESYNGAENTFGEKMLNVNSFIGEPEELITEVSDFNEKQNDAVKSAIGRDLTFIWGPPGTGKTTTIGEIMEESYKRGRTVLLVSHTNTAVDGAIKAACDKLSNDLESSPILRLGQISSQELAENFPEVTLKYQQEKLSKALIEQLENHRAEKEQLKREENIAVSIISQCGYVLNRITALDSINVDIDRINNFIVKRDSIKNNLSTRTTRLNELLLEEKVVAQHDRLLVARKSNEEKCERVQKIIIGLGEQLESTKENIKDLDEKIIYGKKRDNLEEMRSQMFTPEKQGSIIENNDKIIEKILNEITILKKQEIQLRELLHKSENSNFIVKTINKIPSPLKINDDIKIVIEKKTENEHKLASLQLIKINIENEYVKILSVYEELASFPDIPPTDELFSKQELAKEMESKLSYNLKGEINNLESLDSSFLRADEEYNEFVKTIGFDIHKVSSKIQEESNAIQEINDELRNVGNSIESVLKKHFIKFQSEHYAAGKEELSEKQHELELEVSTIKNSIQCSEKDEIEKKNEQALAHREELIEKSSVLKKEMEELQALLAEIESKIISNAKIIGTTLTKAYLSDEIHKRKFDTVILDEASMASIPALYATAYLASGRIIIAGDFKQLPPVTMSKHPLAEFWMSTDVFSHSGVEEQCDRVQRGNLSSNIIILNEQYRMDKEIANLANYYYQGILKSPIEHPKKSDFNKWYKGIGETSPINIIDTNEFHAWVTSVTKGGRSSRVNYLSATLCVALARKLVEDLLPLASNNEAKVLIISPYRPHSKRIESLIEQEGISDLVRSGTVHSFQGSEADIVIYDLVVDEPHWKVGVFNADNNRSNKRLLNVAITRARHKLFVVGNFDYCVKRANKESELRRFLTDIKGRKNVTHFNAKSIFPLLYPSMPKPIMGHAEVQMERMCLTQEGFYDYFYQDLENAKKIIIIYSAFIASDRFSEILGYLQRAISFGVVVYVITKAPEERKKTEAFAYDGFIKNLKNNKINVIYKKGMHEKLVFIDDDIIWSGSLNVLSFSNTQEVMERRKNKEIFDSYAELMKINEFLCRMSGDDNVCPICGGELILAEGNKDPYYYRCINDDGFTLSINQRYPRDGTLTCDKCGGGYKFNMIKEPRWICENDKKHYIKVRMSHLKLPKMLEKISPSDNKKIEEYFNTF